jgi:hypothetical protein
MMYRDSLAVSLCAHCEQYILLVRSTAQLSMRYSKKRVFNTQPVLVAIEMQCPSSTLLIVTFPLPSIISNTNRIESRSKEVDCCIYPAQSPITSWVKAHHFQRSSPALVLPLRLFCWPVNHIDGSGVDGGKRACVSGAIWRQIAAAARSNWNN